MSPLVVSAETLLEQLDRAEAVDGRLTAQNRRDARTAANMRDLAVAAQGAADWAESAATLDREARRRAAAERERQLEQHDRLALLDAEVCRCTCGAWRIAGRQCMPCVLLAGRRSA